MDVDVCIIGAGAAGGVMALELARRGVEVVVLESGPRHDFRRRGEYVRRYLNRDNPWRTSLPGLDRYAGSGAATNFLGGKQVRGVGGGTLHWEGYALRLHADDLRMRSLYGIADSPVGLLGWMDIIYRGGHDLDFVLTNVMAYWLTGTVASSMRLYYEASRTGRRLTTGDVPLAVAQFANDYRSIRALAERNHQGLRSWTEYASGNHFAAHSAPDLWVGDLRTFFAQL